MAYRKKTLRVMSPTTRKVARLIGELESVSRRLKNIIPELQKLEADSQALYNRNLYYGGKDNESCNKERPGRDLDHY